MTRLQALLTILRVGLLSIMGVGLSCLSLSAQAQAQQAPTEHVVQKEFIAFSQAASLNPQSMNAQVPSKQMTGKVGQEEPAPNTPGVSVDLLKVSQANLEKQIDTPQENVIQLVPPAASSPISVGPAPPPTHTTSAESGTGILNLNRLLEAPHKNAYLWAAITLLGVLAVWAGLQIQSRKTSIALSTLIPSEDIRTSASISPQSNTALPANIRALNLNLDLNPQARNTLGGVRSTASTETLQ